MFYKYLSLILVLLVPVSQADPGLGAALETDISDLKSRMLLARKAQSATESAAAQRAGLDEVGRHKMGRYIRRLQGQYSTATALAQPGEAQTREPLKPGHPFVRIREDNAVQLQLNTGELSASLLDEIRAVGMEIEMTLSSPPRIQGWLQLENLDQLAAIEGVERVRAPLYAAPRSGSVSTAGDWILSAKKVRAGGLTGKDIRVGIISDGANDWASAHASGDLPTEGITRYGSCTKREADLSQCLYRSTCNEGTAMAEIVHDIAPDAKIAVASASTSSEFIDQVNRLANVFKADIIVDDLGFYGEPYFEDGDIAQAVAAVPARVLFISAAGNSGYGHYENQFRPVRFGTFHDFGSAEGGMEDAQMGMFVPARESVLMIMQWNDPYNNAGNDYDMALFDFNEAVVAGSFADQNGVDTSPIEGFCYYNPNSEDVVRLLAVNKHSGSYKRLEIFTLSSGEQEYFHPEGSIFGHPGVPSVLAIGTINADEPGNDKIAFYSSRGPARIDFPFVQNRAKPDLVAIDGVAVSGAGGFASQFYGTSAAAPHVAGIAALLMSKSPQVKAVNVREALLSGAVNLGGVGFDATYGYGRVQALQALDLLRYGIVISPIIMLLLG